MDKKKGNTEKEVLTKKENTKPQGIIENDAKEDSIEILMNSSYVSISELLNSSSDSSKSEY